MKILIYVRELIEEERETEKQVCWLVLATFVPALYTIAFYFFGSIGGLLALTWFALVARRLFQLSKQEG